MSIAKVIAKEGLYVRADRTCKSDVVRTMAYGEEFDFVEEYKGWLAVEDGWVKLSDAWVKPVEMAGSAGVKTFYEYDGKIYHDQNCTEGVSADEFMYYMSTQPCWLDRYGTKCAIVNWYSPNEDYDYCSIYYAFGRVATDSSPYLLEAFTDEYVISLPM